MFLNLNDNFNSIVGFFPPRSRESALRTGGGGEAGPCRMEAPASECAEDGGVVLRQAGVRVESPPFQPVRKAPCRACHVSPSFSRRPLREAFPHQSPQPFSFPARARRSVSWNRPCTGVRPEGMSARRIFQRTFFQNFPGLFLPPPAGRLVPVPPRGWRKSGTRKRRSLLPRSASDSQPDLAAAFKQTTR